jgi:RNA polymerase-binding transcription factor
MVDSQARSMLKPSDKPALPGGESAGGAIMSARQKNSSKRLEDLRKLLIRSRKETLARVRMLRGDQDADEVPPPADELDIARSLADVETHASLIDRAEERLKDIDAAMARLETGSYGICQECGEDIPLERLNALPFTLFCVDCQSKRNRGHTAGAGNLSRSMRKRWTIPPEMDETEEHTDTMLAPEEDLSVHDDSPFGPTEDDLTAEPGPSRRRGRPRKRPRED